MAAQVIAGVVVDPPRKLLFASQPRNREANDATFKPSYDTLVGVDARSLSRARRASDTASVINWGLIRAAHETRQCLRAHAARTDERETAARIDQGSEYDPPCIRISSREPLVSVPSFPSPFTFPRPEAEEALGLFSFQLSRHAALF